MARFFRGSEGISQAATVNHWCSAVNLWQASLKAFGLAGALALSALPGTARAAWDDFQVILWQWQTPAGYATARGLGVTAAAVVSNGLHGPLIDPVPRAALSTAGLAWYDENIATDFYAAYHRWMPGQPVNALFMAARAAAVREAALPPVQQDALRRTPSLEDAAARQQAFGRLARVVAADQARQPLYYNLSDEAGIADLAAYWDFDFSPASLAAFRRGLQRTYPSLAALNAAWGRDFKTWPDVIPATAAQMLAARPADGAPLGAWLEFRRWMDSSFAGAVAAGAAAVHAANGHALAGLEGAQAPGWGGYDYTALAPAVDVMEVSAGGNAAEIAQAMNPRLIELSTLYPGSRPADLWRIVLQGVRGVVLWDDDGSVIRPDGTAGQRGMALQPVFQRLQDGLGAVLIAATPVPGPVAVHYSPDSFRVRWLLVLQGQKGLEAAIPSDAPLTPFTTLREDTVTALRRSGLQPRFISPAMVGNGLSPAVTPVVVLPDSAVLSAREVEGLRRYLTAGGSVIAEGTPGLYDARGRRRTAPPLAGPRLYRLDASTAQLTATLASLGVHARTAVFPAPDQIIERQNGTVRLIAWQPATPGRQTLRLPRSVFAYDLLHGRPLGSGQTVTLSTAADDPAIVAVSPVPLPPPTVRIKQRGGSLAVTLTHRGHYPAARAVYRLTLLDAAGNGMAGSGMAAAARTVVSRTPIFTLTLPRLAGAAALRVTDPLSGAAVTVLLVR